MTVIATAGHVDHGKSSLVLALTGTDPDRFEEEKRRGLTIDLGFAHTTLPSGAEVSFVDVPGHVRFLRNMLAGVGAVTGCMLVVAANEGWKPQTEEHLRILELFGVSQGIVVLTKVDLLDDDALHGAQADVGRRVAGSFLASAPTVAVSSTTGVGLDELRTSLDALVGRMPRPLDRRRPRLWIDRVFAARGSGTVVTGTLVDGSLEVGHRLVAEPHGLPVRVRSIQRAQSPLTSVGPGERVALNLAGVDHRMIGRGDALVEPGRWMTTERFDASLQALASLGHDVSRRGAYTAYIGSGEFPASVRVLGSNSLAPGTTGSIRLVLAQGLPLLPGDRYILRESGREETIGGGEILDIVPVTKASQARPDRSIERVVRERGWVTAAELELLTGMAVEPTVGEWVASDGEVAAMRASIIERADTAGTVGLDVAALDARERALVETMGEVSMSGGRLRIAGTVDQFDTHPYLAELRDNPFAPPPPDGVDPDELREMIRRGDVVRRDGVCFHREAIGAAATIAGSLLASHTEGFSVAQFRDATGTTRKYTLPLVSELDARGVTRRRGDLRVAGPRLVADE